MADNYPIYKQLDSMDCGAVCLRMIATYYGQEIDLAKLRALTHVDKDGVSMLSIADAAEAINLDSLGVKVDFDKLNNELPLPCIAHWGQNHFVVVYEVSDNKVLIADPAEGKRTLSKKDFIKTWTTQQDEKSEGVLLLFETTPEFLKTEIQPKPKVQVNTAKTNYSLLSFIKKSPKLWMQIGIGTLVLAVFHFLLPILIKEIIDTGYFMDNSSHLKTGLLAFFVLGLSMIAVEIIREWLVVYVGAKTNVEMVSRYLLNLTRQPIRFFESKLKWDLLQRVYDNIQIGEFLQSSSITGVFYLINILVFSLLLLFFNWKLFLIFLIALIMQSIWVYIFQNQRTNYKNRMFEASTNAQDILLQMINGMLEIKLHNSERINRSRWEDWQVELFKWRKSFLRIDQWQKIGSRVIQLIAEVLIIYFAITLLLNSKITLGVLVAIFYILGQLKTPILELFNFFLKYQDIKLGLERLADLENTASIQYLDSPEKNKLNGDINLNSISYHYGSGEQLPALTDLSFKIPYRKTTAVVGVSGSGKTTLIKLLLGLYSPTKGEIQIAQQNQSELEPAIWREDMAAVFQDSYIFSDSIANNIGMHVNNAEHSDIVNAAKIAAIDTFIEGLPLTYDTLIGEDGIRLSRGQEQQILLARMIYKNPEYIFLDEATSSLDAVTERKLFSNLNKYFEKKTVVIVAHRLSTVKKADKIIVLHKGRFIEEGRHEELLKKKGAYYLFVKNELEK